MHSLPHLDLRPDQRSLSRNASARHAVLTAVKARRATRKGATRPARVFAALLRPVADPTAVAGRSVS